MRKRVGTVFAVLGVACVVLATAGAGSAVAATVFCEENVGLCPAGSVIPLGTTYTGTHDPFQGTLLTTAFETVECTGSTIEWTTTETTKSGVLIGAIEKLSFSGCEEGCAVEARNLPWKAEFEQKAGVNGMRVSSSGAGFPALRLKCGSTPCTYAFQTSHEFQVPALEVTHLWAEPRFALLEGAPCTKEMIWDADYLLSSPESAFLTLG